MDVGRPLRAACGVLMLVLASTGCRCGAPEDPDLEVLREGPESRRRARVETLAEDAPGRQTVDLLIRAMEAELRRPTVGVSEVEPPLPASDALLLHHASVLARAGDPERLDRRRSTASGPLRRLLTLAVAQTRNRTVVPELRAVLVEAERAPVRAAAARWLGELRGGEARRELERAASADPSPRVREAARAALQRVESDVAGLAALLDADDPKVRRRAADDLGWREDLPVFDRAGALVPGLRWELTHGKDDEVIRTYARSLIRVQARAEHYLHTERQQGSGPYLGWLELARVCGGRLTDEDRARVRASIEAHDDPLLQSALEDCAP